MRVFLAILFSLGFHCVVACLLAVAIEGFSESSATVEVSLDLSQVELSFAESEDVAEPIVSMPSTPSITEVTPDEAPLPENNAAEEMHESPPPAIGDVELPSLPEAPVAKMDLPPKKEPIAPESQVAPAKAPRQAKIDVPPKPKASIRPKYPLESRKNKEEGTVCLLLKIDENGAVVSVDIEKSSGFSALDAAAKEAVLNARFNPAKSGSKRVASTAQISLNFTLK